MLVGCVKGSYEKLCYHTCVSKRHLRSVVTTQAVNTVKIQRYMQPSDYYGSIVYLQMQLFQDHILYRFHVCRQQRVSS
jgi:hypothetical protein